MTGRKNDNYWEEGSQWTASFDVRLFEKRMSISDPFQQILRAHLYLEHVLVELLRLRLPSPDDAELDRMNFLTKLKIAKSMLLLFGDLYGSLLVVNNLRNKLAHRLEHQISQDEICTLYVALPEFVKKCVLGYDVFGNPLSSDQEIDLGRSLYSLTLFADVHRWVLLRDDQKALEARRNFESKMDELVDVLRDLGMPVDDIG
jgi:hypothetical protein